MRGREGSREGERGEGGGGSELCVGYVAGLGRSLSCSCLCSSPGAQHGAFQVFPSSGPPTCVFVLWVKGGSILIIFSLVEDR